MWRRFVNTCTSTPQISKVYEIAKVSVRLGGGGDVVYYSVKGASCCVLYFFLSVEHNLSGMSHDNLDK